jgi:hypothetical protein
MKKIMSIAAIATIVLAFTACEKDSPPLVNDSSQDEPMLKTVVSRNFKLKSTGTMGFVYSPDNECYPEYPQNQIIGSGTATHIGKYTEVGFYCVGENGIPVSAWYGTITAANRDQIFVYNADPNSTNTLDEFGNAHVEFDIIGGTGRFENATGHYGMDGHVDFASWEWNMIGEGYITY